MWSYEKRLQFPVNIKEPNAKLAQVIISQYGGPDGEMSASMRYLSQRYSMPYREVAGVLTDIGTEELAHLEMVATIIYQLTRNLSMEEIEKSGFDKYYVDHTIGIWPQAAGGIPFNACEFQVKGDVITDLHEDMAAEAASFKVQLTERGEFCKLQKLKDHIITKMIQSHLSRTEINFLLYISHYQSDDGRVYGVYYKDVCQRLKISPETYYTTRNSLAEKEFIFVEEGSYGDCNILILDNDFSYDGALKEGYINTGLPIFHINYDFFQLKAGEKLLALDLLKNSGDKGSKISKHLFFEKYGNLLKVSERTLKGYLRSIKKFFNIKLIGYLYHIHLKASSIEFVNVKKHYSFFTDMELLSEKLIETACRRNRIKEPPADQDKELYETWIRARRDTKALVSQYVRKYKSGMSELFLNSIKKSIEKINSNKPNPYKWVRKLSPKLIHQYIISGI